MRARLFALVLTTAAALGCALVIVGPRVLNPFDVSWIGGDTATEYLAWSFLRLEPGPSLPLGWSSALGHPFGVSIAYMDPMPGLAVVGTLLGNALPQDFQYFGPYFLVCLALQFHFGTRIAGRIYGANTLASWLGGAFFLIAPAFLWRSIGHFSLTGHWLILAALDQLLHAALQQARPSARRSGTLCLVAAAINPYLAAMTVLVCCAAHLHPLLCGRGGPRPAALGIATALASATAGLVLFGFVTTLEPSQYVGVGYGLYSMNLIAPINPGWPGALLLPSWPLPPEQQMEGYNYLGLGLLLLGAIAIARHPTLLRALARRSSASLLGVFAVSLLLALSTQASIGHLTLYRLRLPDTAMTILASLRGSGRLFWPGYYLLFAGSLVAASLAFRGRWLPIALGAALALQILDLVPLRATIHEKWATAQAAPPPAAPAWHTLGQHQKHLVVLPAWQCAAPLNGTPGGAIGYAIFGKLALDQRMTINSFYASRYSAAQRSFFCTEQIQSLQQHGLQDDTAYVFPRDKAAWVASLQHGTRFCRPIDNHILCAAADQTGPDPTLLHEAITLPPGATASLAESNPHRSRLLGLGWSPAEPWGHWADGGAPSIVLALAPHGDAALPVSLLIRAYLPPARPMQRLAISANGLRVAEWEIHHAGPQTLRFTIPATSIGPNRLLRLDFHCPDAISPAALGLSQDARQLSVGLIRLQLGDPQD